MLQKDPLLIKGLFFYIRDMKNLKYIIFGVLILGIVFVGYIQITEKNKTIALLESRINLLEYKFSGPTGIINSLKRNISDLESRVQSLESMHPYGIHF